MHPIDGPGHVNGTFSAGDPQNDASATEMTPDWCNSVQREILNVTTAAGLAANKADNTQLLQALKYKGIANFFHVHNSSTQAISHNSATALAFDTANRNDDSVFDLGTDKFTAVTDTLHFFFVHLQFQFNTNLEHVRVEVNGQYAGCDVANYGGAGVIPVTFTFCQNVLTTDTAVNPIVTIYTGDSSSATINSGSKSNYFMGYRVPLAWV